MAISRKTDLRKHEEKETFFNLNKVLVFLFILIVVIGCFVLFNPNLTGNVISSLKINGINSSLFWKNVAYENSQFPGNLTVEIVSGDLIPNNTQVQFYVYPIGTTNGALCSELHVCYNGTIIWKKNYNFDTKHCDVLVSNPAALCGYIEESCTELGGKCCSPEQGVGNYFDNLSCSSGYCFDDCKTSNLITQYSLKDAISLSDNPTKGNLTYGLYHNTNPEGGQFLVGSEGFGFAYCNEQQAGGGFAIAPLNDIKNIFGNSIRDLLGLGIGDYCIDSDGGNNVYTRGTCNDDPLGVGLTDFCSGSYLNEYYCDPLQQSGCLLNTMQICPVGYSCLNGACSPSQQGSCFDSDGGNNVYTRGTCTDNLGQHIDSCNLLGQNAVIEWSCGGLSCVSNIINCPVGYSCLNGACSSSQEGSCFDSDGGDSPYLYGVCYDINGQYSDNCNVVGNDHYLTEYYCSQLDNICTSKIYPSSSCNCQNGACVQQYSCSDNDPLNNVSFYGTCSNSTQYFDYCDSFVLNSVIQYSCSGNNCISTGQNCPSGYNCVGGICITQQQANNCNDTDQGVNPNISGTCTDNIGSYNDLCITSVVPNKVREWSCSSMINPPVCVYQDLVCASGLCQNNACVVETSTECQTKGYVCKASCGVSEEQTIDDCGESSNVCCKPLIFSPESCFGFDNKYLINLSRLTSLKTPESTIYAPYELVMKLNYTNQNVIITKSVQEFYFYPRFHYGCKDQECVPLLGPGEDKCSFTSDCVVNDTRNNCIPDYACSNWSSCINGKEYATCDDLAGCFLEPQIQERQCSGSNSGLSNGGRYCTEEDFECSGWSLFCFDGKQTRECEKTKICEGEVVLEKECSGFLASIFKLSNIIFFSAGILVLIVIIIVLVIVNNRKKNKAVNGHNDMDKEKEEDNKIKGKKESKNESKDKDKNGKNKAKEKDQNKAKKSVSSVNDKLVLYVKRAREEGLTNNQMRTALKESGWEDDEIDAALKS